MSSLIKSIGRLRDVATIRRVLFPTDDDRGSDSWLQLCLLAVCPTGQTIVLANDRRIVVLQAKTENDDLQKITYESENLSYDIVFSGCLEQDDAITAMLCLPIAQVKLASAAFTCIAIGFESGFVRFYTEKCQLLLGEQLHAERILSLKCQTRYNPQPGTGFTDQQDSLNVHYPSVFCKIKGDAFYALIRSQYYDARMQGDKFSPREVLSLDDKNIKKWGFEGSFLINDCVEVGLTVRSNFDHLLAEMTFNNYVDGSNQTHDTTVVSVGSKPFIGYNLVPKEKTSHGLSDLAKAVAGHFANKAKAALLPSWLGGGKSETVDKPLTTASKPPTAMDCRFGLCDLPRTGSLIVLSQNRRVALVSDTLGRVFLLDAFRGTVLYVFKGYRDAQCAFVHGLEIKAPNEDGVRHIATFAIIYAPKKGTVELFALQSCRRIATFSAAKFSVLVNVSHSLVGVTSEISRSYVVPYDCYFINSDGSVMCLEVPYHYALDQQESQKGRDLFLFKELKRLTAKITREKTTEEEYGEEVLKICKEIDDPDMHYDSLCLLAKWERCSTHIVRTYVEFILDKYERPGLESGDSEDFKVLNKLIILATTLCRLVDVYVFVERVQSRYDQQMDNTVDFRDVPELKTHMSNLEKLVILSQNCEIRQDLERISNNLEEEEDIYSFSTFLSIFQITGVGSRDFPISMVKAKDNVWLATSKFLFKPYIECHRDDLQDLYKCFERSTINVKDLIKSILVYWLTLIETKFEDLQRSMNRLRDIMTALLKIDGGSHFDLHEGLYERETRTFWLEIRQMLGASTNPLGALTVSLVCSYIFITEKVDQDEDMLCWENYSREKCQWSYECSALEEVAFLNVIVTSKLSNTDPDLFSLPKLKFVEEPQISLKNVLEWGSGTYAELVAKWLLRYGVNPYYVALYEGLLNINSDAGNENYFGDSDSDDEELPDDRFKWGTQAKDMELSLQQLLTRTFSSFGVAKQQFGNKVTFDIVAANMVWEYANAWKNSFDEFAYLDAAWKCLDVLVRCRVKIGLCHMIWKTHFKMLFVSVCKLFDKFDCLPTQTLCKQSTGLTDVQITVFLKHVAKCFEKLIEAVRHMQWAKFEHELGNDPLVNETKNSLVKHAVQNSNVHMPMVRIHFQLSRTLELMTRYPKVKRPKPIVNLFDLDVGPHFFHELDKKVQLDLDNPDDKTQSERSKFLLVVLYFVVGEIDSPDNPAAMQRYEDEYRVILDMVYEWELDKNYIHEMHTYDLFRRGFDKRALIEMPKSTNRKKMSDELLAIATWKLFKQALMSSKPVVNLTYLSCETMEFVEELKAKRAKDWCAAGTISTVEAIAVYVRSQYDHPLSQPYRLSMHLLDACKLIELDL